MEMIGGVLMGILMLFLSLIPLIVIVLLVSAWRKVEAHHKHVERELLLLNQQLGRFLERTADST